MYISQRENGNKREIIISALIYCLKIRDLEITFTVLYINKNNHNPCQLYKISMRLKKRFCFPN